MKFESHGAPAGKSTFPLSSKGVTAVAREILSRRIATLD